LHFIKDALEDSNGLIVRLGMQGVTNGMGVEAVSLRCACDDGPMDQADTKFKEKPVQHWHMTTEPTVCKGYAHACATAIRSADAAALAGGQTLTMSLSKGLSTSGASMMRPGVQFLGCTRQPPTTSKALQSRQTKNCLRLCREIHFHEL